MCGLHYIDRLEQTVKQMSFEVGINLHWIEQLELTQRARFSDDRLVLLELQISVCRVKIPLRLVEFVAVAWLTVES